MPRLSRAHKIIVGQLQLRGKVLPNDRQFIAVGGWALAFRKSRLLHLLAMLIEPGQEKRWMPETAPCSRDDIFVNFLVSVTQVRPAVYVIDRSRYIKALAHPPLL